MKVALYARVSTEKQEKQETIQSQLGALREYAKSNNYAIVDEYADDGYSGAMLDRPALDRLRDDVPKKIFEAVLIHSPDRLARKYTYQELIREELKRYSISIIFLNRPQSGDSPEDNLLNGVQGLIAEYEKAKILERTRRGKLHRAKRGVIVSSIAPYGYMYIPKDKSPSKEGCYGVNPEEKAVVKMIFDLFVDKQMSIRSIAKELTQRGIKPRKGKHWRTSTLHRIIRNETYAGITYYNKHISMESIRPEKDNGYRRRKNNSMRLRPKDQWIPIKLPNPLKIIDKETFEMAQAQLKKNSTLSPRNAKHKYLLRGLLRCGECNSPYTGTPYHNRLFYRCGNRHRTFPLPKECVVPIRNAPMLEEKVWTALSDAIQHPRLITEQVKRLQRNRAKQGRGAEKELNRAEEALAKAKEEESRLLDAYRSGVIDMEQLKAHMSKIEDKKRVLNQERQKLAETASQTMSTDLLKRGIKDYCKIVKTRLKRLTVEEKQQILRLLVNAIVIERDRLRIKGVIPIYSQSGNIAYQSSF